MGFQKGYLKSLVDMVLVERDVFEEASRYQVV